jgi:hypothetical protein
VLYREFGITVEAVAEAARRALLRLKQNQSAMPKGTLHMSDEISVKE